MSARSESSMTTATGGFVRTFVYRSIEFTLLAGLSSTGSGIRIVCEGHLAGQSPFARSYRWGEIVNGYDPSKEDSVDSDLYV